MKIKKITYYFCIMLLLLSLTGYSQGRRNNPPDPKPPPIDPGLPIDGGITYLMVAGIAYGVYEMRRKK